MLSMRLKVTYFIPSFPAVDFPDTVESGSVHDTCCSLLYNAEFVLTLKKMPIKQKTAEIPTQEIELRK